jgi:4-aminobutyrate aminotransferase/(S)-3-amino-2-methylpropionate transaminase
MINASHAGGLGGTYSGSPLACVAAVEAIKMISDPAFLSRANEIGRRLRNHLQAIQAAHPNRVGEVRGLGPMLAMEIVRDAESKAPDMDSTSAITAATLKRGLIAIRAGLYSNVVRLLPPLILSDEQIDEGMMVLREAAAEVFGQ